MHGPDGIGIARQKRVRRTIQWTYVFPVIYVRSEDGGADDGSGAQGVSTTRNASPLAISAKACWMSSNFNT